MFTLWPLPHRQCYTAQQGGLSCLGEFPRPSSLQLIRGPEQRNRAKVKGQCKSSERQLSQEDIANLSDGKFKALVIKMLTELIELGRKMKAQMKDPK